MKTIYDYKEVYFDFEVLPEFICVSFLRDDSEKQWDTFVFNESDIDLNQKLYAFRNFIETIKKDYIFVGWNVFYDKTILYEILQQIKKLATIDNKAFFKKIYQTSLAIVNDEYKDFAIFDKEFIFYDSSKYRLPVSLKVVSGESGFNIKESEINFDATNLTKAQQDELVAYNINDVDILYRTTLKYKEALQIRKELTNEFSADYLPSLEFKNTYFFNKIYDLKKNTQAYSDTTYNFYESVKNNQPYMNVMNKLFKDNPNLSVELKSLYELFFDRRIQIPLDPNNFKDPKNPKNKGITFNYLGMEVNFALGGIHGSKDCFLTNKVAYMADVASMYPNIMLSYNLQSKAIYDKNKAHVLQDFLDKRLFYKKAQDKKLKMKDKPYKVLINSLYGATRAEFSNVYDPIAGTNLCILGQFLILGLCDMIKDDIEQMIQINTDGIYYIPKENHLEIINQKIKEWEKITNLTMEITKTTKTFNFNVNNYIIEIENADKSKSYKTKGRFINQVNNDLLKQSSMSLVYDYYIIGQLIFDYFVNLQSFDTTLAKHKELWKYASVKKITKSYDYLTKQTTPLDLTLPQPYQNWKFNNTYSNYDYEIVNTKINRFFAIKNGYNYKKYACKKQKTYSDFLDEIEKFYKNKEGYDTSNFTNQEQTIYEDNQEKIVFIYQNQTIFILKKYKSRDAYSFNYKTYASEKIPYLSDSSIIYNQPLFKNYDNNYNLTKDDYLSIDDFEYELDMEYYKQQAFDVIWAYSENNQKGVIYEKFTKVFPYLKLPYQHQSESMIDDIYKD